MRQLRECSLATPIVLVCVSTRMLCDWGAPAEAKGHICAHRRHQDLVVRVLEHKGQLAIHVCQAGISLQRRPCLGLQSWHCV